jgi:hypothetical protein
MQDCFRSCQSRCLQPHQQRDLWCCIECSSHNLEIQQHPFVAIPCISKPKPSRPTRNETNISIMTYIEFEMDLPEEALYSSPPGKSANNKTTQQAQGKQQSTNNASHEGTNWEDLGLDITESSEPQQIDESSSSQKPYKNKTRLISRILRTAFSPKARNFTHTEGTAPC